MYYAIFYIDFRKLKIPEKFLKELFNYVTLRHIIKINNGYFTHVYVNNFLVLSA